ncbi:SCO4225 family membrane protein [Streptomyces sp. NPDC088258]|uniref:SCO4225 family membrane protein n=1 Tax=Streptomyces sp. NPDC088258 TaxID=3365849 RepID=UPI00380BDB6B
MADSARSLPQTLRHHLVNPVALGYLAIVAAVCAWVTVDTLFVAHQDASLAGVWAFFVTGPTSFLFVALPGPLPFVGIAVGAFVQAFALGALYRWFTKRPPHRTHSSAA